MSIPKISVIMPVYNASKYLFESINSILNQTYRDFEFIILNDSSTDDSLLILQKFQIQDNRIILINKENNVGPATLRNEGFELAKGEFIALMDADDISDLTRFEKQIEVLKNESIDLCATNYTKFGESISDEYVKHFEFHNEIKLNFLFGCYIANPTVMLRKKIINGMKYDSTFFPVDDYELLSRLITNHTFYNIQESLLKYRWHETNISQTRKVDITNLTNTIRNNQFKVIDSTIESSLISSAFESNGRKFPSEIIEIVKTQTTIKKNNIENKKFDTELLNIQFDKTLTRTLKKVKKPTIEYYKFLVENDLLKKLKIIDRIKIYLKCRFNF